MKRGGKKHKGKLMGFICSEQRKVLKGNLILFITNNYSSIWEANYFQLKNHEHVLLCLFSPTICSQDRKVMYKLNSSCRFIPAWLYNSKVLKFHNSPVYSLTLFFSDFNPKCRLPMQHYYLQRKICCAVLGWCIIACVLLESWGGAQEIHPLLVFEC